jgi:hypothetical protein
MQHSIKTLLVATTLAVLSSTYLVPANAADAVAAIASARDAQKQAASVGGEWRDTGKMIKKAEEAAKLAAKAEEQGMLGYMRATSQTSDNFHI